MGTPETPILKWNARYRPFLWTREDHCINCMCQTWSLCYLLLNLLALFGCNSRVVVIEVCLDLARHHTKFTGCIEQHLVLCKMLEWHRPTLETLQWNLILGACSITALCCLRCHGGLKVRVGVAGCNPNSTDLLHLLIQHTMLRTMF